MRTQLTCLGAGALLSACTQTLPLGRNDSTVVVLQKDVTVTQDGTPAILGLQLSGDAAGPHVLLAFDPNPNSFGVSWLPPSADGGAPQITFTATPNAPAGPHLLTLRATNTVTGSSGAAQLNLTVAIAAQVAGNRDPSLGWDGGLVEVVTTSVQPALFQQYIPDIDALAALHPPHMHVQVYEAPWQGETMDPIMDWNFDLLDSFVKDLVTVGDGQPELQINVPLKVHTLNLTYGPDIDLYAAYCADLVAYYNKGSFSYGTGTVTNPNRDQYKIHNWGILNDFNTGDNMTVHYVTVYNEAVMQMRAVDDTIHVSALEFSDDGATVRPSGTKGFMNGFALPPDDGGVAQPVDSVAVHMYATPAQGSTVAAGGTLDVNVFAKVAQFRQDVKDIRTALSARADLAATPIWVTQSNVNANFAIDGISQSSGKPFMNDPRGTDAFFASWAPYMFSQLGQQGNASFSHWVYTSGHDPGDASVDLDLQNAEVNYDDARKFLSYWVDKAMADAFPAGGVPDILPVTTTETAAQPTVDLLATRRGDGSVVIMVSNLAVVDPDTDIDGHGLPRTVVVDLHALAGTVSSGSLLTIDTNTDRALGPMAPPSFALPADLRVPVYLGGYGVAFLTLTP